MRLSFILQFRRAPTRSPRKQLLASEDQERRSHLIACQYDQHELQAEQPWLACLPHYSEREQIELEHPLH